MSDPVPIKSQTRDIVERMYDWIDEALADHYDSYFITTNIRFDISHAWTFPVVVIDFEPLGLDDVTLGRRLPFAGTTQRFIFTLYLYQKYNEASGEDYDLDNQALVRNVIDTLTTKNQDATEMTDHYIYTVNITEGRRSETGLRNVSRYILTVEVETLRGDSYP